MFGNVGKELKFWAQLLVVLLTIAGIIMGANMIEISGDGNFFYILIFGVIGHILGRLSGIVMYAFGELVEATVEMRDMLHYKRTPPSQPTTPPVLPRKPWECPVCGVKNTAEDRVCSKCGYMPD